MSLAQGVGALLQGIGQAVGALDLNRIWESRTTGLIVGFLAGLLSAPIVERVKDGRRKRQIEVAIRRELEELKYRFTLVSFTFEMDYGDGFNRAFIARTKDLIAGYDGANMDAEQAVQINDKFLKKTDEQIEAFAAHTKAQARGKVIPTFQARYLDSIMGDLRLLGTDVQAKLLDIRANIGNLNDMIEAATYYNRLTFTVSTPENHQLADGNNIGCLKTVGREARVIAEKIHTLYSPGDALKRRVSPAPQAETSAR